MIEFVLGGVILGLCVTAIIQEPDHWVWPFNCAVWVIIAMMMMGRTP